MNELAAQIIGHGAPEKEKLLSTDSALIAVDNNQLAATIRYYLQSFGVKTVDICRSCVEARAHLEDNTYSLCYVDYNLPVMGGADFVRFLRTTSNESSKALVTMLVTSPQKEDIFKARDAGSNEIILLPISTKHLMGRLNHMLHNPRPMIKAPEYVGPCRRRKRVEVSEAADRRSGQ